MPVSKRFSMPSQRTEFPLWASETKQPKHWVRSFHTEGSKEVPEAHFTTALVQVIRKTPCPKMP